MALTGSVTIYTQSPDLDNGVSQSVTYPSDLPSDDPNYDKRGTTESTIFYPPKNVVDTVYTSSYVVVDTAAIHLDDNSGDEDDDTNTYYLNVRYKVYSDLNHRRTDFLNPLLEQDIKKMFHVDINDTELNNKNLIAYAYNLVTQEDGMENLNND